MARAFFEKTVLPDIIEHRKSPEELRADKAVLENKATVFESFFTPEQKKKAEEMIKRKKLVPKSSDESSKMSNSVATAGRDLICAEKIRYNI